jgi:hypothetical protein
MEHVEPAAEPAGGTTEQPAPPPGAEEVALPGQIPADDGTVGTVQLAGGAAGTPAAPADAAATKQPTVVFDAAAGLERVLQMEEDDDLVARSRAWTEGGSVSANDENELATIRVRTMYKWVQLTSFWLLRALCTYFKMQHV